MTTKSALFVTPAVPVHNGDPASRMSFLEYRALCVAYDVVFVIVLDATGNEFYKRAKLPAQSVLLPVSCCDDSHDTSGKANLSRRSIEKLTRVVKKQLSKFDFGACYVSAPWAKNALLSTDLELPPPTQMPSCNPQSVPGHFMLAQLIHAVYGSSASQSANMVSLVLPGDSEIDEQLISTLEAAISETNKALGTGFLCACIKETRSRQMPGGNFHRWDELTGILSQSVVLVNAMHPDNGAYYLDSEAGAFGAKILVPSHLKLRPTHKSFSPAISFESLSQLRLALEDILTAHSAPRNDRSHSASPEIDPVLKEYLGSIRLKPRRNRLPNSVENFLFSEIDGLKANPFVIPPTIYFVPATGLLNVEAIVRHSSNVNEIRIADASGRELGRIIPSRIRPELAHQPIDGGFILHDYELPDSIRLKLYASGRFCRELTVEASDILVVQSEIASLTFPPDEGDRAVGTIWSEQEGRKLTLIQSPNASYRLMPSKGLQRLSKINWTNFDVKGFVSNKYASTFSLAAPSSDGQYQRTLRLGRCYSRPSYGHPNGLSKLKDKHAGERAWIIGNGPSVSLEDLNKIASLQEPVFCFNRFYLAHEETTLRETYLISADTLMISDFGSEMLEKSAGLPILCAEEEELPPLEGEFVRLGKLDTAMPLFSTEADRFVHVGGSSVFVAMQVAHYMGFRELITYGMDYSFSQTPVFDPRYAMPVCFDEGNHFIQGYRSEKPWCPPNWRDISFGFLKARTMYEASGKRIVNATRGGKLEIFDRIPLEQLLN